MRNASVQTIGVGVALLGLALLLSMYVVEGYQVAPQGECPTLTTCKSCAAAGNCAWCASSKTCMRLTRSMGVDQPCDKLVRTEEQCSVGSAPVPEERQEPTVFLTDPCARFKGCKECATQDGCGWCPAFGGRCSLMDKFGRPMNGLCHPSEYRLWPGQCPA
jgi:hypothetical protein